ncbi:hypothetical protein Cgig2_011168 [Carnegiea gigantea]|uniref:Zinc finger C3HC4 RING-type domain-containing protein n=1 Tax=Carnegiea gigantea TaxID=171969 RepID=A0A9Q1JJB4_9CARY|nr:hypothetical protein Cgig2_011168 [Carnegiea gigantea]
MLTQRVQFSYLDGIWIVDDFPRNSSTSQPSVQSLESWVLDELPINPSTSQPNPVELWISQQIERRHNSDFLQRIREQLMDLELQIKTKVFSNDNIMDADICPICQAGYEGIERMSTLRCGHEYHTDCIKSPTNVKTLLYRKKMRFLLQNQTNSKQGDQRDNTEHQGNAATIHIRTFPVSTSVNE